MEEMWKNSAIIAKRNVDDNQNPISVQLYELKPVIDVHSCIVLNQLPDEFHGIEIEGFTQVYDIDKISTKNFKVDYANGVLYFHPNNIGKMLTINYYGIGCTLLSASRIYTKYDKYGNVLETLEEFIDKAKLYIKAIESLGGAVEVINKLDADIKAGDVLHENLSEDIEIGTPLDASLKSNIDKGETLLPKLVEANATATQKKIDLDKSIKNATDTNETLTNTNQSGIQTNLTLQQTIATGKDSIDKINATGNKSLIIGASQFVNNEYIWTHNMNSEELHITMYDADTKEPLMLDCKPDGKNKLIVRNGVEHPNVKVVLSASFYQGNALFGTNVEEFAGDSIEIGSKKVRLKDGSGAVENPITDSDAVFMSDGTTKLTKKISDMSNETTELKTYLNTMSIDGDSNKIVFKKVLKSKLPVLTSGEPALCTDTKELYVGTSSGNVKITKEEELNAFETATNNALALKQQTTDNSFATTAKTVKGAIGELKVETTTLKSETADLRNKLTYVTTVSPTLGSGLSKFDDTVENTMTLSMDGFVNYNFCVTGGKSNNNIANGATLCTVPASIPIPKIVYGVVSLETTGGERRLAMSIVNPSNRQILLYFIGETTAVSSAKGTITWRASTP